MADLKYGERIPKKDPPARTKDGLYCQLVIKMAAHHLPQGSMTCRHGHPLETNEQQTAQVERLQEMAQYNIDNDGDLSFWKEIKSLSGLWLEM